MQCDTSPPTSYRPQQAIATIRNRLPVNALSDAGNVFTHLLTDHDHYFELGGENYHTAFNTWAFFRGTEHDPWASFVDALALPEHLGQLSQQNWHNQQLQTKRTSPARARRRPRCAGSMRITRRTTDSCKSRSSTRTSRSIAPTDIERCTATRRTASCSTGRATTW